HEHRSAGSSQLVYQRKRRPYPLAGQDPCGPAPDARRNHSHGGIPMKLEDMTGAELNRAGIAVEEAAHAIGGVLLGGRVTECWARTDAGRVTFEGLDSAHDASVAWWGIYARARFEHGGEPSFDALREALAAASPEDAAALGGRMAQGVHGDVRHAEPAVRRLASRLFRTG